MRQTLSRLARMTTGYGAVQWAGPLISFVFTPILTRILLPSDYGVNDYVMTVASGAGTLGLLGLPQAILTHFNDRPDDAWRRRLTGSVLAMVLIVGIPFSAVLVLLSPQISRFSFQDTTYTLLFQIVGAALLAGLVNGVLTYAAQAALRVRWGMVFSLTTIIATTVGNILFIIVLRLGVLGLVLVPACSGLALTVVGLWVTRPLIGRPDRATMGLLLRSGLILLPATLSTWGLQMVDRLFLVHYVSTQDLGYYAIANRIAALLFVLLAPVYTAWTPLALAMKDEPQALERYVGVARYLVAAALAGALFLGLFATEILIVMTRAPYLPAAPYVGWLAYVQVFSAMGAILNTAAMASKRLGMISWTVLLAALLNIVLNGLWIPAWGVWGATFATVVGYGVQPVLIYAFLQRAAPVPYPAAKVAGALLLQAALLLLGMALPPLYFPIRIAVKAGLFLALPLGLVALQLVTPFELREARSFLLQRARLTFSRLQG